MDIYQSKSPLKRQHDSCTINFNQASSFLKDRKEKPLRSINKFSTAKWKFLSSDNYDSDIIDHQALIVFESKPVLKSKTSLKHASIKEPTAENNNEEQEQSETVYRLDISENEVTPTPEQVVTKKKIKNYHELKKEREKYKEQLTKQLEDSVKESLHKENNKETPKRGNVETIAQNRVSSTGNTPSISPVLSEVMGKKREKYMEEETDEKVKQIVASKAMKLPDINKRRGSTVSDISKQDSSRSQFSVQVKGDNQPEEKTKGDDLVSELLKQGINHVNSEEFIPQFVKLHPLEREMSECFDLPPELMDGFENTYMIEHDLFTRYKQRLSELFDSEEEDTLNRNHEPKEILKKRKLNRYKNFWYLPPKVWKQNEPGDDKAKKKLQRYIQQEKEMRNKLKDLASSKLFKVYLMKHLNTVPDWLKDVSVQKHIVEEMNSKEGFMASIPPIIQKLHKQKL
ncbi:hypothetical protein ABK040_016182 [Willaertia magna]